MDQLVQHIESLVFVSENPISFKDIKNCLEETFETKFKKPALEKAIIALKEKYQEEHFSFEFLEIAGGFQFLSKPSYHGTVATYLKQTTKRRLSRAALETLSIIAYKQPVAKSEMEKIRGVSCDYSVQKLLEKELVQIMGRSEGPGRALLYGTSDKFMEYFGLKNLEDLPKPKDFRTPDNEIGEQAPIDEITEETPSDKALINETIEETSSIDGPIDEIIEETSSDEVLIDEIVEETPSDEVPIDEIIEETPSDAPIDIQSTSTDLGGDEPIIESEK